jgi:hypothetical protein
MITSEESVKRMTRSTKKKLKEEVTTAFITIEVGGQKASFTVQ